MGKSYSGDSSHDFINVHLAVVEIFTESCLVEDFLDILHGVGSAVSWKGA